MCLGLRSRTGRCNGAHAAQACFGFGWHGRHLRRPFSFLVSCLARKRLRELGEFRQILLATALVPTLSAALTARALFETYQEALESSEDGYQLIMFTWMLLGGFLIAVGLRLGFAAGKLAERWVTA
jgi:hypothetical protein